MPDPLQRWADAASVFLVLVFGGAAVVGAAACGLALWEMRGML